MTLRGKLISLGVSTLAVGALAMTPLAVAAQEVIEPEPIAIQGLATITSGDTCGANVCWVLGTGAYGFNSTGLCQVLSDSLDNTAEVGPQPCTATSTGRFTNVVCGTGLATGSLTINEGGVDPGTITASYTIVFAGSVGVLVSTSGSESDGTPIVSLGVGLVDLSAVPLVPNPTAPGAGPCTPSFNITAIGFFTS